ncbi:hypothetical protein C492_08245 [Natronococcus jeotgali DSM 18795]|uniref:Uncharacterized protein n=1 Tax=Natronococcus jeotgali DSM 18795 TaxID=1227498 RepID=L9XKU4_9EURY|nr:hypothetical protein C492_08245 [Natronococcus jeotgali DSM 18795]
MTIPLMASHGDGTGLPIDGVAFETQLPGPEPSLSLLAFSELEESFPLELPIGSVGVGTVVLLDPVCAATGDASDAPSVDTTKSANRMLSSVFRVTVIMWGKLRC